MPIRRRKPKYNSLQAITPLGFEIPKGHLKAVVSILQETGTIDKDEALELLRTRPYIAGVFDTLKYRGATNKYHVFSYPDPEKSL